MVGEQSADPAEQLVGLPDKQMSWSWVMAGRQCTRPAGREVPTLLSSLQPSPRRSHLAPKPPDVTLALQTGTPPGRCTWSQHVGETGDPRPLHRRPPKRKKRPLGAVDS